MNKKNNEVDPQIQLGYELIMKGYSGSIIQSDWEKVGEYFKQFSLYDRYYCTKETNSALVI